MLPSITRRSASGLILALAASSFASTRFAFAQSQYFNVTPGGQFKPIIVAVTQFAGDGGADITAIITNNFSRSVFLARS